MTCPFYKKHKTDFPRRKILKSFLAVLLFWLFRPFVYVWAGNTRNNKGKKNPADSRLKATLELKKSQEIFTQNLGVSKNGMSDVYLAKDGSPEKNMTRLLDMLGGIENIIDKEDIVLLKPNAQWWSQGMTNTDAMKAFIDAVLAIPNFKGEIIIADNHQFLEKDSRGWITTKPNGKYNYNQLINYFRSRGNKNVTKYHWQCAGPNPNPIEGDASQESKIVKGPWEGDGYVWTPDHTYSSELGRKCIMTYPIFTSNFSGTTIDLKNGAWRNGKYTDQPVKFINFSALNYHSPYCGVTASVKNYMGIVDMTCGFPGTSPKGYWNTHFIGLRSLSIPFEKYLHWRVRNAIERYNWKYFHHTGAALGTFMREVRMADLNFITAHWIGYGSRIKTEVSGFPKALLASKDPVALDYVACQKILLPLTKEHSENNFLLKLNDASNKEGPFYKFLESCHKQGIGNLIASRHRIIQS